ncbi:B12-binding domain-containing radical SAM protein [Granulicella arctica]|uniref:B12-binding domain-containing radical SAM protein n=1 Tax=Granulicella arctica TaxID=940613 RepID=UPI0021E099CD|nr:B12-binding domain-containing radical SAM protein [Granulicella arctica]
MFVSANEQLQLLSNPLIDVSGNSFPPLGNKLNVLMIWPRFPPSFWGFEGVLEMVPEKSVMPPLGLITVAALCPSSWTLRLLDLSFERVNESELLWADLVLISAMQAQRVDTLAVLAQARLLGRRTFIGGPWASSEPDFLVTKADHVLAGEAEEVFADIAVALELGTAKSLYRVLDKPDMSTSPMPRFDLLHLEKYTSMSVQFSRGCPFQCEFCDIITIYGRRPRAKPPAKLIAELDTLRDLGWRNEVFIVDDNFIGNHKLALQLTKELTAWQARNARVISFYTEASIDLADRPELLASMVEANFMYVFLGIETPSAEALKGSSKFQNLRGDLVSQVNKIRESGLWVLAGFIVGFDSDDETIFERQLQFIEKTAITWAMAGVLQAPPTTALFDRMKLEGRLIKDSDATTNFSPPNFRTVLPLQVLLRGLSTLLSGLYTPDRYFGRALRSIESWQPRATQQPPELPMFYNLRVFISSMWQQGVRSNYKLAYWKFLLLAIRKWSRQPAKMWLAFMVLLSANHFLKYAQTVSDELELQCQTLQGDNLA